MDGKAHGLFGYNNYRHGRYHGKTAKESGCIFNDHYGTINGHQKIMNTKESPIQILNTEILNRRMGISYSCT